MGKYEQQLKWELAGLGWAMRILCKTPNLTEGYKELQKEIRVRKAIPIPMDVPREAMNKAVYSCIEKILSTYPVAIAKVLNEDFGFGGQRLVKFMERFHESIEAIAEVDTFGDSYCTFSDYAKELQQKYEKDGLAFSMAKIYKIDELNEAAKDRRIDKDAVLDWLYEHGHVEAAVDLQAFLGIES